MIRNDFAALHKGDLSDPLMDEIEDAFTVPSPAR
jgi:hypothetical protein